jgi:hypothetical protein
MSGNYYICSDQTTNKMRKEDFDVLKILVISNISTTGTNNFNIMDIANAVGSTKIEVNYSIISLQDELYLRDYSGMKDARDEITIGAYPKAVRFVQDEEAKGRI